MMQTLRTVAEVRAALEEARRDGARIGLVPTMGALHSGHMSLMRHARAQCDVVVASLFVNPAQFEDSADLAAYPRNLARDSLLAAQAGVDHLFAPANAELYPEGFATTVSVGRISELLEGAHRGRAHFEGVATIVTKLLNIVQPDVAYFGQKDAQQVLVIRRTVRDLNLAVRIEACPTVRDQDGLALSSRNARLSADERERAPSLHRALSLIAARVDEGHIDVRELVVEGREELDAAGVTPEYLEIVDAETLAPLEQVDRPALAVLAARIGTTRLIDNQPLLTAEVAQRDQAAGSIEERESCRQVHSR